MVLPHLMQRYRKLPFFVHLGFSMRLVGHMLIALSISLIVLLTTKEYSHNTVFTICFVAVYYFIYPAFHVVLFCFSFHQQNGITHLTRHRPEKCIRSKRQSLHFAPIVHPLDVFYPFYFHKNIVNLLCIFNLKVMQICRIRKQRLISKAL